MPQPNSNPYWDNQWSPAPASRPQSSQRWNVPPRHKEEAPTSAAPKRHAPGWTWGIIAAETLVLIAAVVGIIAWRMNASPAPEASAPAASEAAGSNTPRPNASGPEVAAAQRWAVPEETVARAREELAALEIKGRAPKNSYSRDEFGQKWSDDVEVEFGHNGCDTRNDILGRDLRDITFKEHTRDCLVLTGTLTDPFSGEEISFERGPDSSPAVHIDHIVPLADAWQKGAQQWDAQTRKNFANDPRNLIAVDGPLNNQKSAGDAATWLPPNKAFRCQYAVSIIEVKHAYGVWVTEAEHAALSTQLDRCAKTS